jgi:Ca-activated chloride channel family protein
MKLLATILTAAALALSLAHPEPARAGTGALDAVGKDGAPLGGCPLEHTDVQATVSGFVARVVVAQRFRSPFPDPVEAIYTFPLSERAAVDAMTMRVGDRVTLGQIKRRAEAREIYEDAKRTGRVASLLDEERPNVFTQAVANLMPGAEVEIRIEYVEPLAFESGSFELVFPTVVGPRFSPPGTKDADLVTPPITAEGTRAGHDIAISVDVDAGVPLRGVSSPLHAITVDRPSPTRARVRLEKRSEIPNRDFVLRYEVSAGELQSTSLAHRSGSGDGYVSLVLLPPERVTARAAAPKELIFVVDRSGSQMGAPLEKAKETMRYILDHMNPNDTFQVVDFGNTSNALFPAPQPASAEMRRQARAYIDALEANGGTMMAEAVERVCNMPADAHRLRVVTFMTDGYVGNDLEVLGLVQRLRATSRWFPFGTGNSVNRFLIDGMARLGGGEAEYVLLGEPGEEIGRKFYERIASPVLTDVAIEWNGLEVIDVFPRAVSDVWAERPLVVHARYRRAGTGQVVLTGFRQGEPYRQAMTVLLPEREPSNEAIASMWARAKVDDLTTQDLAAMQSGTFPELLEKQIVDVALAHRLVTPFTSFVAVEDRVVNEGGTSRTIRVPVEMPDSVEYEGIFGAPEARADASGGKFRRQALAAAPMPATGLAAPAELAKRRVAEIAAAEPVQSAPLVDASRRSEDDADAAATAPLGAEERRRLAKSLRILLEAGPAAPGAAVAAGEWLRLEVTLRSEDASIVRELQRAGLQIESVTRLEVVGLVRVSELRKLAAVDGVHRIEPAPAAAPAR